MFQDNHKKNIEKLDAILTKFNDQNVYIENFLKNLTKSIENYYNEVLKGTRQSTTKLIEQCLVDYKSMLQQYNKQIADASEASIKDFKNESKSLRASILSDVRSQFDEISKVYSENCSKVANDCLKNMDETCSNLIKVIIDMQKKSDNVDNLLEQHSKDIQNNISAQTAKLQDIASDLKKVTNDVVDKIRRLTDEMRGSLSRIQEETSEGVVKNISESSAKLIEAVNGLRKSIATEEEKKIEELYSSFNGNIQQSVTMLSEAFGKNTEHIKQLIKEFDDSNKARTAIMNSLNNLLKSVNSETSAIEQSTNSTSQINEKLQEIATQFSGTTDGLAELIYRLKSISKDQKVDVNSDGKKVCPKCKKENEGNFNYCPYCGTKI